MWKLNDKEFETVDDVVSFVHTEEFQTFVKNELNKGNVGLFDEPWLSITNSEVNIEAHLDAVNKHPFEWSNIWINKETNTSNLYILAVQTIIKEIDEKLKEMYPEYKEAIENSNKVWKPEDLPM